MTPYALRAGKANDTDQDEPLSLLHRSAFNL